MNKKRTTPIMLSPRTRKKRKEAHPLQPPICGKRERRESKTEEEKKQLRKYD